MNEVLLVVRCAVGVMMFLHGYNHMWGPGGLEGTTRWFAGLGFRPARLHATLSSLVELAIAVGLVLGLLMPLTCAALVGVMVAAGWTDHRPNGFFMFRNGYEHVLTLGLLAVLLAAVGPGTLSIDHAIGLDLVGARAALIAGGVGVVSGALLLTIGWRPAVKEDPKEEPVSA